MKSFFVSRYLVLCLLLSGIVFSASQCGHSHEPSPEGVRVNILSPSENTNYRSGQSVHIDAVIEGELHAYSAVVTNPANRQKVFNYEAHTHSQAVKIDTTFKVNVTTATEFVLTVEAKDHHLEKTGKTVKFKVLPQ